MNEQHSNTRRSQLCSNGGDQHLWGLSQAHSLRDTFSGNNPTWSLSAFQLHSVALLIRVFGPFSTIRPLCRVTMSLEWGGCPLSPLAQQWPRSNDHYSLAFPRLVTKSTDTGHWRALDWEFTFRFFWANNTQPSFITVSLGLDFLSNLTITQIQRVVNLSLWTPESHQFLWVSYEDCQSNQFSRS